MKLTADTWRRPLASLVVPALLSVMACLVFSAVPGAAVGAGRSEQAAAAARGLARVDSLLQAGNQPGALAAAQVLWRDFGTDPVYGWQIEGRLGLVMLVGGEPGGALPHLENTVRRQPLEAAHHRNLAAALMQLGRRGRALSEYQSAVELAPGDAELRREYGQLLLAFRDLARASVELHTARELCGGCPETDQPLASLYLLQNDFGRAVPLLKRIYVRAPSAESRHTLVAALSQAGNDSLLVDFVAELPANARSADEWRLLIEGEGRLGQCAQSRAAVAALSAAADSVPAAVAVDARFWGQVALNLLASGDLQLGLTAAERAVELAPDNVVYLNNKVVLLTRLGRDAEARKAWAQVLALDPSRAAENPEGENR